MRTFLLSPLVFLLLALSAPAFASAGVFEVSGWLPYWKTASSTADVLPHLSELTEVNPFVFTLQPDGSIADNGPLSTSTWASFIAAAKAQKVRVIPTIMTGNGSTVHTLLSNTKSRIALEDRITKLVKDNNFDGIEIDFEGKMASDANYFSTFLKGLYMRMGNKWVMCDIEARTPIEDAYYGTEIPAGAGQYANDYAAINKYCDRVKIMAYDQQTGDLKLSAAAASSSQLYAPVSDPAWVKAVVELTKKSINPKKIMIGVPTYGYEYDVTAYAGNEYVYDIMWTFNPLYAQQIKEQYGVAPARAPWGEMNLSYFTTMSTSTSPISGLFLANAAAAAASTIATSANTHSQFRYLVWPDAQSVAQKIALAKQLGVRGVSIFKLDGGEDPQIWSVLQGVKK
jgi:spore germination protein YaaH